MAFSNSDWIVKLHYAFQDAKNVSLDLVINRTGVFQLCDLVVHDYGLYAGW